MTKMKTRLTACLTAAACLTGTVSAMTASALDIGFSHDVAASITIETDTFTYVPNYWCGFSLTTDVVDPTFMVVGACRSDESSDSAPNYTCLVVRINPANRYDWYGWLYHQDIVESMDGTPLQIGDLLKADGDCGILDSAVPEYIPFDDCKITNLGNGADLLGEEFERVIRLQTIMALTTIWSDTDILYQNIKDSNIIDYFGDVNVDDTVDILDCITVNKQLLGSEQLSDYIRIFGDVNGDGVLDSTDSLMILKEVVGLTENFEEV